MKAVVLSITTTQACVLAEDGSFQTVENHDYQCGDQINMEKIIAASITAKELIPIMAFSRLQKIAVASILILILAGGMGTYAWAMPYTYLTIDSNPSIELTANRFDRVLSLRGLNEDGTLLAKDLQSDVLYTTLEDAVLIAVDYLYQEEYIDFDSENMVMTVASNNQQNSEQLAEKIRSTTQNIMTTFKIDATILAISQFDFEEARKNNTSPGAKLLKEKNTEDSPLPQSESIDVNPEKDPFDHNQTTNPDDDFFTDEDESDAPKTSTNEDSQEHQDTVSPNTDSSSKTPNSNTENGSDTDSETENGSDTDSKTENGSETNSNTENGPDTDSETENDSDTDSKTENDSDTDSNVEANQIQSQNPSLEPKNSSD